MPYRTARRRTSWCRTALTGSSNSSGRYGSLQTGATKRRRVIRDLLPYALVIAGMQLLPFSTSGVGATAREKDGRSVTVIGTLASPAGGTIETLNLGNLWALQRGDIDGGAAPFLLGSPELFNYGTNVVGLDWGVFYAGRIEGYTSTEDGATDLRIIGDNFTVEQQGVGNGTYPVSTCLTVTETAGVYSVSTCSDVRVELEAMDFVVETVQSLYVWSESCEALTYAVFNPGLTYRWRNLTVAETVPFTNDAMIAGTEIEVLCGEIYESIIEACLFQLGDHLYVGDWNIREYEDSCEPEDGTNLDYTPLKHLIMLLEIDANSGELPSMEEHEVTVAMLAEVAAGSGTIYSRQQLALVLGVFSRLSGMKSGVGTGYHPETVVMVKVSRFVLFLWVLLLAAGSLIHLRERKSGCKAFIPSKAWDWYAIGARESLGDGDASGSTPPSDDHYLAKYGCLKSVMGESDGTVKRLSWIRSGSQAAETLETAEASTIPQPQRRRESCAVDEAVGASRCVPCFFKGPLRRSTSM